MTIEFAILVLGALLLAAIASSKLADKMGVPTLLLFLVVGMLAGSEGVGGLAFDHPRAARSIGSFALMVILFAGGLETNWNSTRAVLAPGLVLSTAGVALTTLFLGAFAWFALGSFSSFDFGPTGLGWMEALLLAAIVSSTDAAAVFSVYRSSPVQPRRKLRDLLEFESGSNDPMAVLLTTMILSTYAGESNTVGGVVVTFAAQLSFGVLAGAAIGWIGVLCANKLKLIANGLYPILVFAFGCTAFGLADWIGGNAFLAAYVAGVVLGNGLRKSRSEIMNFHDGLSWLMQIVMFIMLGLLVFPSRLIPVAGVSIALALFLMFVARPLSVFICLRPFKTRKKELAYVSWVGLRGSVPIVLATFPYAYGMAEADRVFNVIFFIVLTSVLVQGLTLVPATRWLGVAEKTNADQPRRAP